MSEELKESNEVDETTARESSTEEINDESSKSEEDASIETTEQSEEDAYAAELEQEEKRQLTPLERAEKKIVELKLKAKSPVDPEKLAEEVWSRIDARLSEREVQNKHDAYDKEIQAVATSPSEAKLIQLHLTKSIKPTGNVEADVRRAKLLANETKILKTNQELATALRTRSTISTAPSFNGAKIPPSEEVVLTAEDKKLIQIAERTTGRKAKLT